MKIEIEFTEPLLGTLAGNKELAEDFIASKHPDGTQKDEIEAIPEALEKASTGFSRNDEDMPMLWDYQIKGFFKEACLAMIHTDTMKKEELKKVRLTEYLYKRTIDQMIFINPRRIELRLPEGCEPNKLEFLERPLRGQTMRGERIALARSEIAPAGTKITITISSLNEKLWPFIDKWLIYGALRGLGQWRNASYGRFSYRKLQ